MHVPATCEYNCCATSRETLERKIQWDSKRFKEIRSIIDGATASVDSIWCQPTRLGDSWWGYATLWTEGGTYCQRSEDADGPTTREPPPSIAISMKLKAPGVIRLFFVNRTPKFHWCVGRWGSNNKHHNKEHKWEDLCIQLRNQSTNMQLRITIPKSDKSDFHSDIFLCFIVDLPMQHRFLSGNVLSRS